MGWDGTNFSSHQATSFDLSQPMGSTVEIILPHPIPWDSKTDPSNPMGLIYKMFSSHPIPWDFHMKLDYIAYGKYIEIPLFR